MHNLRFLSLLTTALLSSVSSGFAEVATPLLTIDVESYDALVEDANSIAGSMDQDSAMIQAQIQGMLGAELAELIDKTRPWHAAIWLESMEQPPLILISLPIADFAAFEEAVQTSMLGQLGAKYMDAGNAVVLFGSQPGVPVDPTWEKTAKDYATTLTAPSGETLQFKLQLNDSIRAIALSAMATSKAQMIAVFDDPAMQTNGMSTESMQSMMSAYFSFYEAIIRDLDSLRSGFQVSDANLLFNMDMKPVIGSVSADFLKTQTVDLTPVAEFTDWDSDIAVLMGMGALPDSMQTPVLNLIKGTMPLYGLDESVASELMDAINQSLPLRSEFSMNFADAMTYDGFYEVLEGDASDVYEKWLKIYIDMVPTEVNETSMYSDVHVGRNYRMEAGHSVDLLELTLNPEHPSMKLPEQKAMMESMFGGDNIRYEMCLVDNRIYMASKGSLGQALQPATAIMPFELNANTRVAASLNLGSLMKHFWGLSTGQELPVGLTDADTAGIQLSFQLDVDDGIETKTIFPLKLFKLFSSIQ